MDNELRHSPERLVKITYGRSKRKSNPRGNAQDPSPEENEPVPVAGSARVDSKHGLTSPLGKRDPSPALSSLSSETAVHKADALSEEASPKRSRPKANSGESRRKPRHDNMSVTPSATSTSPQHASSSRGRMKPPSMTKHPAKPQSVASFSHNPGDDDSSSISDMSKVVRIRRTEAERLEYFANQPESGELELHCVQCLRCLRWVNLGRKQTYAVRPWEKHRDRCDQEIIAHLPTESNSVGYVGSLDGGDAMTDIDAPNGRVAAAERRARLVNDSLVKSCTPRSVECASCNEQVQFNRSQDYDLAEWEDHRAKCCRTAIKSEEELGRPDQNMAVSSPQSHPRTGSSSIPVSLKRKREADEVPETPSNRPRNDNYVPYSEELSGPLSWLLLPFRTFVRGFRESFAPSE